MTVPTDHWEGNTITLCCGHMVNGKDGVPCCRCPMCRADHGYGECDGHPGLCGYSNCFRPKVGKRGFVNVCQVHKADPRKWPDGRFTGSTFIKGAGGDAK